MKTTILIPEYRHPNLLEVCLKALIQNSRNKHRILIVGGEPKAAANDFMYNKNGQRYQKYKCVDEFLNKNRVWLEDNDITFIDTTQDRKKFKEDYERKGGTYEGGVDTALNDNIGAEHVDTEWFFWNWDDDFFAAPGWDENLFKYMDESRSNRIYLPTLVQPIFGDRPDTKTVDPKDAWTTSSHISVHRLALPVPSRSEDYIFESEVNEYVTANSRDGTWEELCHIRHKMCWVPLLLKKSFYLGIGGCNYQGPGYDIEFDDRLGKLGIIKVMSRSSFVLHKAYVIFEEFK